MICVWSDPSAFITKISKSGPGKPGGVGFSAVSRSLMNAIFCPSGRQLARPSKASESAVRFTGLLPFGLIVQMSLVTAGAEAVEQDLPVLARERPERR